MSITDGRKEKNSEKENILPRSVVHTAYQWQCCRSWKWGGKGGFKKAKGNIIKSIPIQTHPIGFILLFPYLWRAAHLDITFLMWENKGIYRVPWRAVFTSHCLLYYPGSSIITLKKKSVLYIQNTTILQKVRLWQTLTLWTLTFISNIHHQFVPHRELSPL